MVWTSWGGKILSAAAKIRSSWKPASCSNLGLPLAVLCTSKWRISSSNQGLFILAQPYLAQCTNGSIRSGLLQPHVYQPSLLAAFLVFMILRGVESILLNLWKF